MKINNPNLSSDNIGSYSQTLLEKTSISNELSMISCLETELKYIECFIINNNKQYSVNIYYNS